MSSRSAFAKTSNAILSGTVTGLHAFARWTGDVHVHAGYNTLWDAVINRQQMCVDVQGVQAGKSHRVTL